MLLVVVWLAVLGLCFGSFVNALVWRLHEREELKSKKGVKNRAAKLQELSMWRGRSMCSHCHHPLAALDLIPVASWVLLRGRCRYCHHKIEDPPVVELVMPALFIASYLLWPNALHGWSLVQFCFWLIFAVGFVALALYDLRWYILPDRIVYPLILLAAVQVAMQIVFFGGGWQALAGAMYGVLIASGIFYALFLLSQGAWIGGGDVKLGIVLGLLVGGPLNGLLLLFLSSVFGTIVSVPLLITRRVKRDTLIPFGPFLLLAATTMVLFGVNLSNWLSRLVLN